MSTSEPGGGTHERYVEPWNLADRVDDSLMKIPESLDDLELPRGLDVTPFGIQARFVFDLCSYLLEFGPTSANECVENLVQSGSRYLRVPFPDADVFFYDLQYSRRSGLRRCDSGTTHVVSARRSLTMTRSDGTD